MVWYNLNTQYVIFVVTLFYALLHITIESIVLITKHRKWVSPAEFINVTQTHLTSHV